MKIDSTCAIERTLCVVGERWTPLILREAVSGVTRFAQFRERLGVAPDVLAARLATLVEHGVMTRAPYREPGARTRLDYQLTDAGRELCVVLGALQQWGDEHLPWPGGPSVLRRTPDDRELHVGFVDERGAEVELDDVRFVRTAVYPGSAS
jgi:DNA-binding HxlR family transcriptional regulator